MGFELGRARHGCWSRAELVTQITGVAESLIRKYAK